MAVSEAGVGVGPVWEKCMTCGRRGPDAPRECWWCEEEAEERAEQARLALEEKERPWDECRAWGALDAPVRRAALAANAECWAGYPKVEGRRGGFRLVLLGAFSAETAARLEAAGFARVESLDGKVGYAYSHGAP